MKRFYSAGQRWLELPGEQRRDRVLKGIKWRLFQNLQDVRSFSLAILHSLHCLCAWQWGPYMLFTCISYILLTRAMLWAVSSSWTAIPSQHQPTLPWNGNTTIHNMTLLFTQLASHPFFSISSTTSVFSLNLKFLSGCANVVLYTFSYCPRAAILPKFYTKQTAASVAFLQMTTFISSFIFVHISLQKLSLSSQETSCLDSVQHLCCLLES